jgi:hypothetical protein
MRPVKYVAADGCLAARVGASTMVLLPSMEYLELDEVGAAIFDRVASPRTVDEIVAELVTIYDVDVDTLRCDVAEYLETLCRRGAVESR